MGTSKPVFTCIKTKAVHNVQRWVNKRSDMLQSLEKQMTSKNVIFPICLLQPRTRDQGECVNVSHSKAQFLAGRNLRSRREV